MTTVSSPGLSPWERLPLYEWLDENPRVQLLRCEKTNNPSFIATQPKMASINAALQVDLFGQVNATRLRGKIHSGIGGSTDFLVGSMHSPGGTGAYCHAELASKS